MSAADVEIIRELYAAFNREDYEAATAMLHDDVELHQAAQTPDADSYFGKQEFVRGLVRWLSGFERGFKYELLELIDAEGAVFVRFVMRGRGRESGVELDQEAFNVWEVRDGRPFRLFAYFDEGEARAAAGLPG
jgi:ketosteroid isomerase-like protein